MFGFGRVATSADGYVLVEGSEMQLWDWAHRARNAWPCSTLTDYVTVRATLDPNNGDLVDLIAWKSGEKWAEDSDVMEIAGDELTAWLDDCLAGTEYRHLARSVGTA